MTPIEIGLAVTAVALCGVMIGALVLTRPRRQQNEVKSPDLAVKLDNELRQESYNLIEQFSQRLASAEGRLTGFAAQLEGVALLRQRLDALESCMPSVQEAYEKYADQIGRADKRDTERQRRATKTAGQAAGELASVAGVEGGFPAPSATAPAAGNHSTKRPGVLGGGGRR